MLFVGKEIELEVNSDKFKFMVILEIRMQEGVTA
jgi:hypothetical protein